MKTAEDARKEYELAVAQREATKRKEFNKFLADRDAFMKRNFNIASIEKRISERASICERDVMFNRLEDYSAKAVYDFSNGYECGNYYYDRIQEVFKNNNDYIKSLKAELMAAGYEVYLTGNDVCTVFNRYTGKDVKLNAIQTMKIKW